MADYFTVRGWMVAFPQRRGRGQSEGLYDEGFGADRSQGCTCETTTSLRGAERALADIGAAVAGLRERSEVASGPILMGGVSRAGVLSIAFAGRHPEMISGVLNFVGGWIGTACNNAAEINGALFREGSQYHRPTLWLYGDHDGYYPISHSRRNFDLFRRNGGEGRFLIFDVPGGDGHAIAEHRDLWAEPVVDYLAQIPTR